jgi:hypothetical protein
MDLLILFAFIVLPPPLMALLVAWLWQLSRRTALPGVERSVRLAGILLLAGGLTWALHSWLGGITQPIPSGHTTRPSISPWARDHLGLTTLLLLAGVALALGSSSARRLGSLSFASGVALASGLFFFTPYLSQQTAQRLAQARLTSRNYEATGWQFAIKDSFQLEVVRRGNLYAPVPNMKPPEFPGGDAALAQQLVRLVAPAVIPDAYRIGFAATVEVEFILEPTGRPTLPHVSSGLGPGYDEAAVYAVTQLPAFRPARRGDGRPIAIVWQILVPFN